MAMSPQKISLYLGGFYLRNFLFMTLLILSIVYLFDTVELLRRAGKYDNVPLLLVLQMGLFKLPEVGQMVFPFAVLFSAMFTLWQLSRRSELIAIRSAGLSIWRILGPILFSALMIGIIQITVINPFGALLIGRFENLENTYLKHQTSLVSFSQQGLWLKQDYDDGHVILHARDIVMPEWKLKNAIVWFFDANNSFRRRLDAQTARLNPGEWSFEGVVTNSGREKAERSDYVTLATDLTLAEIMDSFASPETISFWKLRSFIQVMEKAGFDATTMRIHFQVLLSQPLLYVAMILLAACVTLQSPRSNRTFIMVLSGVFIGFLLFFLSSFLQAFGASGQIPIVLAAWAPALISFLLGIAILMNLEDG